MNYYIIPNNKELNYECNIILPLKEYSIGFDVYFDKDEIISISKDREVSVIINKFLHKSDFNNIKSIIESIKDYVKYIFIEDLGLTSLIDKDKVVINQSHIINNYDSINYFKELGYLNITVNNDLTIDELLEINSKVSSNLFIYSINRNTLMYSKRKLISAYNTYTEEEHSKVNTISEVSTKKNLLIKEENDGTLIFNNKLFILNEYVSKLDKFNFIINLSNLSNEEVSIIKDNYMSEELKSKLEVDNYFLHNKIIYKVGDK